MKLDERLIWGWHVMDCTILVRKLSLLTVLSRGAGYQDITRAKLLRDGSSTWRTPVEDFWLIVTIKE